MRCPNTHLIWIPEGEEREWTKADERHQPTIKSQVNSSFVEWAYIALSFLQLVTESGTTLTKLLRPQHFLNWMSRIRWQYPHYKGQKPGNQQKNALIGIIIIFFKKRIKGIQEFFLQFL